MSDPVIHYVERSTDKRTKCGLLVIKVTSCTNWKSADCAKCKWA